MSDEIAIRVRGLGKKYTIGGPQEKYLTLRDAIVNSVKAPFHRILHRNSDPSANEFWALKDVSFDVHKGEVIGIIGQNGAGKSTLLKILSRITTPSEGGVEIFGHIGSLLEVGTGFHPELTGRENIFLSGSILGMKKREIELRFDEIVKFAEIEKFIDTPVKRYSSGMYVRLAFAVAAHMDTEILLVDEVLAVGDAGFQKKCLGKMGEVAKGGKTVIFVSHSMPAIESLCPRIIWIDKGKIVQDGISKQIIAEYVNFSNINYQKRRVGEYQNLGARRGTGEIQFTHFRLLNNEGVPTNTYNSGEPIWMEADFEVYKDVDTAYFCYAIYDSVSRVLITYWREAEPSQEYYSGQKGTFSVKIQNNLLNPRNLYFYLVINASNPDFAYDVWDGAGTEFSILHKSETASPETTLGIDFGLITMPGIAEVKIKAL
jgi:lipopolysaccharide transport system ATP-binding protein